MIKLLIPVAVSAIALVAATPALAQTTLLTTAPVGGTTTVFTATGNNGFGNPGPVVVNGFTVTGNPQATYGDASYFIGSNGSWSGGFSWGGDQ